VRFVEPTKDGGAWVVLAGSPAPVRLAPDGTWTKTELGAAAKVSKDHFTATGLYAASGDDVWLVGWEPAGDVTEFGPASFRSVVLRSKPGTKVKIHEAEAPDALPPFPGWAVEEADPQPMTAACKTPFVQLFGSNPEVAGDDYAFPATGKAIAGDARLDGVDYVTYRLKADPTLEFLGAIARTQEQADALATAIHEKVKGSAPKVVCFSPQRILRQLHFER
jgi:hypothetical protein